MKSQSKEESQNWWDGLNHFSPNEFDSPDEPGSGKKYMNEEFVRRLDKARELSGMVFNINSGYRTKAYNRKVGGVPDSPHLTGYAADIDANNSRERFIIVKSLILAGFTRIGVSDTNRGTFIHVDSDPNKADKLLWIY